MNTTKNNKTNTTKDFATSYAFDNANHLKQLQKNGQYRRGNKILLISLIMQHKLEFASLKWPKYKK